MGRHTRDYYFQSENYCCIFSNMLFLTGATGYLGSYILLDLLQNGFSVRAMKRPHSSMEQVNRVFRSFCPDPSALLSTVEWVDGDTQDIYSLMSCMRDVETVVHCAGIVSYERKDRKRLHEVNVEGTANMVNASLHSGVKKFLFLSSVASLGFEGDGKMITEKTVWKNSKLHAYYTISKYNGEKEVWRGREEGLKVIVVNPSLILGFGDISHGTYRFFDRIKKGLSFYPGGANGFVYVKDVSKACTVLLRNETQNEKFILNAENLSYRDFFKKIADILGKKAPGVRIGRLIIGLAWREELIRSCLTGSLPLVTPETARISNHIYSYDGSKIEGVGGFHYTPLEVALNEIKDQFTSEGML
jgi:dihydroflavonol-4-reductase